MNLARNLFVLTVFAGIAFQGLGQSRPIAKAGVLDATAWNFQEKRLPLNGYWRMVDGALVDPADQSDYTGIDYFFPSVWNDTRAKQDGQGYATFFLQVLVPDSIKTWSVEVPPLYSSCKLWINGVETIAVGKVDTSAQGCVPQWIFKHGTVLGTGHDTLQIVMQIANFQHDKGGIKDPVYLGTPTTGMSNWNWAIKSDMVETCVLGLLGLTFLIFAAIQRKKVILYFALLCLTWSARSVFSGLYLITYFYPDFDWYLQVRVEYISLYLGMIWATLFLSDLFSAFSSRGFSYALVGLNIIFILFTLFTPPLTFTPWLSLYLTVAGVAVVYAVVLVIRALLSEQAGAWFLMASIITGILVFGYDIVAYQASFSYNFVFLNVGYLVIFLLTAIALLFQLEVFKSRYQKRNMLTYKDMFGER